MESIQTDATISEQVRAIALSAAERFDECRDADAFAIAAWNIARERGLAERWYLEALRQARTAVDLEPGRGELRTAMGAAMFRAGHYHDAANALARANELSSEGCGASAPTDLALLAMNHWRVGERDEARVLLQQARDAVKTLAASEQPREPADGKIGRNEIRPIFDAPLRARIAGDFVSEAEQLITAN